MKKMCTDIDWDRILALSVAIIPPSLSLIPMFMYTEDWATELLIYSIYGAVETYMCKTITQNT